MTSAIELSVSRLLVIRCRILLEWTIKRILGLTSRRPALRRTRTMEGHLVGNSALIVGNGPSASRLNWDELAEQQRSGMHVWAINFFPLSAAFRTVQPDFLVLSDPLMHPSSTTDDRNTDLWKVIREEMRGCLVVPTSWWPVTHRMDGMQHRFLYFDDSGLEGWTRNISPLRARGYIALTAYKALAFAHHLGYDAVYIIGIDNTMFRTVSVDTSNRLIQAPNHFFERGGKSADLSSTYPRGMGDYFADMSMCFSSLRRCFIGTRTFNLDPNSLIDVFLKLEESSLIQRLE